MKKIPVSTRMTRVWNIMGYWVLLLFVGLVVATLTALFFYRSTQSGGWGPRIVGILTAFQIKILNYLYRYVARIMTNWENL